MLYWILIIFALVVIDQVTKMFAVHLLTPGQSVDLIEGVFRFTYVENRGAAFGMLSEHRWVFMIISVAAIALLLVYLWKFAPESRFARMAICMIIGGGIGNMIDRIFLGYVVDFLDFCAFPDLWMWVFNMADVFVCVGGGMLVVWLIISMVKEAKADKAKKVAVSAGEGDASEENGSDETHD
ncbi:MAG: signal peptidase II [Clostridia bacterium]|nr:signal peptidase II [Clostridia bacterium]